MFLGVSKNQKPFLPCWDSLYSSKFFLMTKVVCTNEAYIAEVWDESVIWKLRCCKLHYFHGYQFLHFANGRQSLVSRHKSPFQFSLLSKTELLNFLGDSFLQKLYYQITHENEQVYSIWPTVIIRQSLDFRIINQS